ncbi:MAG: hypothetical protein A2667_02860 [Candidatus Wildermuthbacteria bacterium RIFCSPHIGHO2_01_FULL_47_27]|uniref:DDH domain-containing protein n=2 Tax=Candidatus Wildermuthiibacteriota TaxID=1817923 RepID=A0A1G2RSL0_9BACT|nr:MAG: Single-stranded-DNA-specific exonuclease RecJ [Parcubacteria group bacterium GW2011_GWA2_47_9]OHA63337.1 MAG: hypothetical protein A2667_02860 [Candidatus Wildermuthbacteria bacterium RIFCSPHIGHO2_01_FULL_47_27]OHA75833.1 MAG: hypothetical protein A3A32_02100 [Candidatus Wildermuthbacteria bacterium RIFCSPLOWO2_01_FULL_48_35]
MHLRTHASLHFQDVFMAEIKNLTKAANRILKAIANRERIILYGDSDPDGVSSVLILEETMRALGAKSVKVYFPDRETEGYGINGGAMRVLKRYAPALFITLDCGITNIKETEIAKKMGFEVMIVDHHKVLARLPKASIIVDPKQKGDKSSAKELACAGIVYKLAQNIFKLAQKQWEPERFLELAALATIADQMPTEQENEKIIREGLGALRYTKRPAFKELINLTGYNHGGSGEFREKLLPALNVWSARRHINPIYEFLTETSAAKAKKMAQSFLRQAKERKKELRDIYEAADARVAFSKEPIIFEGDSSWPLVFSGAMASRLCHKYKKPIFIYKKGRKESPGAARTPRGIDVVEMMDECKKFMITYGGHPQAGGFRAKNKDLDKLKACLLEQIAR